MEKEKLRETPMKNDLDTTKEMNKRKDGYDISNIIYISIMIIVMSIVIAC